MCLSPDSAAQQNSALAEGRWIRIGVTQSGVYKISSSFLSSNSILAAGADPANLQISGYGGGMVPEPNASARHQDLPQLAVQVVGGDDGRLDAADYLLFYAQGPDALTYDQESGWYNHQKNIYSDTAYYFIGMGTTPGLRQTQGANEGLSYPAITSYEAVEVYEKDEVNIISSGRRWFGDAFGLTASRQYTTALQELTEGNVRLRTAFINTNRSAVSFSVLLNNQLQQEVSIRHTIDYQYAEKGWIAEKESQVSTAAFTGSAPLQLQISLSGGNSGNKAYLDYYLLQTPTRLRYRGSQLSFISPQSINHPAVTYQLADAPAGLQVWDISNPQQPLAQEASLQNNQLLFGTASNQLKSFIAFTPADAPAPVSFGPVPNQNLHADLQPELLIVTHQSLLAEAERLADFRRSHDGLAVKVVTTRQVYNEFSSGRQDVAAIRDYVRYLHQQGGGRLRYLLLFGRGYYDYKQRTQQPFNLVPLYESYNSVHPINSYASDDFYGFLEEHEGDWTEDESGNQSLDIGIGRLPVTTATEARQVVDKLIRYSSDEATFGNWRQRILFVADDEDGNVHQQDAEQLARLATTANDLYSPRKIYVDAYPKIITANSQTSPGAQKALRDAIDQGALIVNFTGHGSHRFWTFENIFSKTAAENLQNRNKLPLFVTATCEFGLHDGELRSGAESLILNPGGGAIGLLTTARPVFTFSNFKINSAFYKYAFPSASGEIRRLGDITRLTKNEGVPETGVYNRNFVLLGDPSLQLAYPKQPIALTAITRLTGAEALDTLKAYEIVRIEGMVVNPDQEADASFSGTLLATVYDKSDMLSTLGQSDPAMTYSQRQNVLHRGEASVKNGHFFFEMAVPKNIRYETGFGRIELYATHADGKRDAAGASEQIKIGGSAAGKANDRTPPQVQLYLNDTTFVSGNPVASQAMLLAKLQDEHGINISYSVPGQNIEAVLNDTSTFILNDYYISTKGNYKEGWLRFPLYNLPPGRHRLNLQAWDTHGNGSVQSIDFVVPGSEGISITSARNYPNPLREQTNFAITHTRSGDDLEIELLVYGMDGRVYQRLKQTSLAATGTLHLSAPGINNKNLNPGIYVFKVVLRSLSDGSVAERAEKLVILK
ncbi:type IX secretion system sortase PorU [Cesiribacter sp. SM1]|uniref:type IX secretion system sortase PorU n=1 Tax=Cesiribacter sp. SM1 TaxID=2861196 RepID=UPI001CD7DD76|nr:type IX secretion system sortase PorU [Cesiribacter sp. SM1]